MMHLHGDHVFALHQQDRIDGKWLKRRFLLSSHCERGERVVPDVALGHVAPEDFLSVEIDHRAVIPHKGRLERDHPGRVGHLEGMPKVGSDVLVAAVAAKAQLGCFAIVAVAKLRLA